MKLYLSNYVTKAELKETRGFDTSTLASKIDLAGLKTKIDNLDVGKLNTTPADLIKLSNVVDNDFVKKTVYDKLMIKSNAIDTKIPSTTELVNKTQYNLDKQGPKNNIEDVDIQIPNASGLVKKTGSNTKRLKKIYLALLD